MCKEIAKELRSKLKEMGYNRNIVGVTSSASSINVTVKSLDVDFEKVEKLANIYESIQYDQITGEILCGANTYVNVNWSKELQEEIKEKYKSIAQELWNTVIDSKLIYDNGKYRVFYSKKYQELTLQKKDGEYYNTEKRYSGYNDYIIAEGLTYFFMNYKVDVLEESKSVESKEIKELKTIEDLQEGDCTIIVKDSLGKIKEFNGYYNSKFEVVYMTIDSSYEILGYKQSQEQIKQIENNTTDNTKNVQFNSNKTIKTNNIDCKVVFNEDKNGIELHFNNKPSEDIRNKIKSIGFRWSKYNKVWYIKDSQEVRTQLQEIGLLNNSDNNNVIENLNNIEIPNIEVTEINETNFNIDKTISDRENEGHWTFRTKKRDHQQEILSYLNNCKNEYINITQFLENKTTINYYNKWFNGYMNRYYNNYYNRLKNNANNPSWLVTGRAGRNINKDKKYQSKYDNLMRDLISLEEEYKTKINKIKSAIQKEKTDKIKSDLNSDSLDVKSLDTVLIKEKININSQLADNIFNNTNTIVNCYNYKDKYYIIKNWGYWRLYNSQGKEINILGRCHKSLIECKKTLLYVLIHNKEVV